MKNGHAKHASSSLQQRDAAEGTPLRFSLQRRDAVESTNIEIKQLIAQGAPEGVAVSAREQRGGYGRQGRSWASPRGGLYLSLLLRPALHGVVSQELSTLSLALGLAVREVLASCVPTAHIFVKWPNDVVCEQGKLCGISLEGIDGAACVGIGINVFPPDFMSRQAFRALSPNGVLDNAAPAPAARVLPSNHAPGQAARALSPVQAAENPALAQAATGLPPAYLADLEGADLNGADLEPILQELEQSVLDATSQRYVQWCEGGFAAMQKEFGDVSYLTGKTVQVLSAAGEEMISGQVRGVSQDGRLLVLDAAGQSHAISSGEAHIQFPSS